MATCSVRFQATTSWPPRASAARHPGAHPPQPADRDLHRAPDPPSAVPLAASAQAPTGTSVGSPALHARRPPQSATCRRRTRRPRACSEREVAQRLGRDRACRTSPCQPGIGRSLRGSAVIWRKTPVSGPPLCSCPVECRKRGPKPSGGGDAEPHRARRARTRCRRASIVASPAAGRRASRSSRPGARVLEQLRERPVDGHRRVPERLPGRRRGDARLGRRAAAAPAGCPAARKASSSSRRGVLALLDVRLVERVDPEHDAGGRSRRDLPAQELGAQRRAGRRARCGSPGGQAARASTPARPARPAPPGPGLRPRPA